MGLVQDSGRRENGEVVWEITPLGKSYADKLQKHEGPSL